MQWLIVKISSPDAQTLEYALLSRQQQSDTFSHAGWDSLKELSKGKRIILLIPTEEVALHQVSIPVKNHKLLAKAIPFALEENLAEDIESLHFSYFRESSDKPVNVAAISARRLQQWLDVLEQHDLLPHIILPDVFALPAQPDSATLMAHQQRTLIRSGLFSGYSLDTSLLDVLLPKIFEDAPPQTLLLDTSGQNFDTSMLPEATDIKQGHNLHRQCDASLLQALPLNLLSQFQRKGQQSWTSNLSRWKSVAVLAALTIVLWTAITGLQNRQLAQKIKQLDQEIASVYSATFPDAPVDNDYRILHAGMAEQLKLLAPETTTGKTSALEILALVAPAIKKFTDITLSDMRFDSTGLNLIITAPSLSKLEAFRAAIDVGGIDAQVVSSNSSASKVESTLRITKETP